MSGPFKLGDRPLIYDDYLKCASAEIRADLPKKQP